MLHRLGGLICSLLVLLIMGGSLLGCDSKLNRAREFVNKKEYIQADNLYQDLLKKDEKNEKLHMDMAALYCDPDKFWQESRCLRHTEFLKERFAKKSNVSESEKTRLQKWYSYALFRRIISYFQEMRVKGARDSIEEYAKLGASPAMIGWMHATVKLRSNLGIGGAPQDQDELKEAIAGFEKVLTLAGAEKSVLLFEKEKLPLKWYAQMGIARVYDVWLTAAWHEFQKQQAKKRAASKKRKTKAHKAAKPPQFVPNEEHFNKALQAYQKAKDIAPSHFKAYWRIGTHYAKFKRDFPMALRWLEQANKKASDQKEILCDVGRVYLGLAQDNPKERSVYFHKARNYLPNCPRSK